MDGSQAGYPADSQVQYNVVQSNLNIHNLQIVQKSRQKKKMLYFSFLLQNLMTDRMMRDSAFIPQDTHDLNLAASAVPEVASIHKSASLIGAGAAGVGAGAGGTLLSGASVLNSLPPQTPIVGTMNGSMASTMPMMGMMAPAPGAAVTTTTMSSSGGGAIAMQNFAQPPLPPTPQQQQLLLQQQQQQQLLLQHGIKPVGSTK